MLSSWKVVTDHLGFVIFFLGLVHLRSSRVEGTGKQVASVQFFEVTSPVESIDEMMNCLFLDWVTKDAFDIALISNGSMNMNTTVGESHGLQLVSFLRVEKYMPKAIHLLCNVQIL